MSVSVLNLNQNLKITTNNPSSKSIVKIKVSPSVNKKDSVFPTFPDVTLKKLPFYNVKDILLKPSTLQPSGKGKTHSQNFSFYLTPGQVEKIKSSNYKTPKGKDEYRQQVQLRLCMLETTSEQTDDFPNNLSVKVNGRIFPIQNSFLNKPPNVKRISFPINITSFCKLSSTIPNVVNVSWSPETGKLHTASIYQVENLDHKDLFEQLKKKGQRQPEYTKALVKEKLSDQDQEISTASCKVTLACPLGKMRMTAPCRASTCDHLQCFDAQLYLQMNERNPKWVCPVCNKPALVENLLIDGFFLNLVRSPRLPTDEHEIVLHNDGSWDPLPAKIEDTEKPRKQKLHVQAEPFKKDIYIGRTASKRPIEDIDECITLDESCDNITAPLKKLRTSCQVTEIECIDLD